MAEPSSILSEPPHSVPPAADRFAPFPASWYLFGHESEIGEGPLSRDLLGRRLVAFRDDRGELVVLDASCSHLGADLGRGCVVKGHLRCPFHHWEYRSDGTCAHVPETGAIPEFARQARFPVEVRHGYLFVFNGRAPLFPLPFFQGVRPEELDAGRPFALIGSASWYMVAANGFDEAHFRTVHDRELMAPPEVESPAPFGRRIRYTARVVGDSVYDRLLRWMVGPVVQVTITNWGGTLNLVTAQFRRARSLMMIATRPIDRETTLVETIVFAPRRGPLMRGIVLGLRRWFSIGFLRDDFEKLAGVRYRPQALLESDRMMIEHLAWMADLPQHAGEDAEPPSSWREADASRT